MKGVLVCHGRVLLQEEGAEEEEAKEGEADNLCPASQPGSASQWSDETRRLATATGRDPELVFTSISLDRDNCGDWNQLGAGGLLLAVLHQRAEHSEECRCGWGEQGDRLLQQVWLEHVVCEDRVQC